MPRTIAQAQSRQARSPAFVSHCARCGYDLASLRERRRCPECGDSPPPCALHLRGLRTTASRPDEWFSIILASTAAFAVVAWWFSGTRDAVLLALAGISAAAAAWLLTRAPAEVIVTIDPIGIAWRSGNRSTRLPWPQIRRATVRRAGLGRTGSYRLAVAPRTRHRLLRLPMFACRIAISAREARILNRAIRRWNARSLPTR